MKNIRCKAKCGLSIKWTVGQSKEGRWKALSCGSAKSGSRAVPTAFIPFEVSNAVMNSPSFDTEYEAEVYVRSI